MLRILAASVVGLTGGVGAVGAARLHVGGRAVPGAAWTVASAAACAVIAASVDDLRAVVVVWMAVAATALAAVDAATSRLPNAVLYPTGAVGAVLVVAVGLVRGRTAEIGGAAVGVVAGVVPLYVVWLVARSGGLGFGDVRLAGWLGMHLGVLHPLRIVAGLLLGLLAALAVTLVLAALGRQRLRDPFPLGPYLALGAVAAVPWGGALIGA